MSGAPTAGGAAATERRMVASDIAAGLALCRAAGWNQVQADWALYLAQNPAGCSVLVQDGQVAGTVITVDYQQRFGWVGMVLVRPELRGAGLGTRLLRLAFDHLRTTETLKLDATPAGRRVYVPLGFVDEYGLLRMERAVSDVPVLPAPHAVRPMVGGDLPAVLAMDAPVFGADRAAVLLSYHSAAPELAFVAEHGGQLVGYLIGRRGHAYDHVGAVVATGRGIAMGLLSALLASRPSRPLLLDAMLHDEEWVAWLKRSGFREQRPYTRMVRGPNRYPGQPGMQFSILGPELG